MREISVNSVQISVISDQLFHRGAYICSNWYTTPHRHGMPLIVISDQFAVISFFIAGRTFVATGTPLLTVMACLGQLSVISDQ